MGRRSGPATALAITVALALTGCGTRLDPAAVTADSGPGGSGTTVGPGTTTATTGPSTNPASDVGVSPTEITLGLIVSKTSPLGAETFSGPMYGAQAYVKALNERGGINGRTVRLITCDDNATGAGNRRCVRKLIDDDKVFAFVGNSILSYSGAEYVNSAGVPDIGGQPIDDAYEQYAHLFNIYGSDSPRQGTVGFDGLLSTTTEIYRYFSVTVGAKTAAVVAFNQSESLRYANLIESGLKAEGYTVVREQIDFAVPNFDAAAIDMRARGVDVIFDAMDVSGNVALCRGMDSVGFEVKAKVLSVQSWTEAVRSEFSTSPACRNSLYVTARTRNYEDTQYPLVAQFRAEIHAAFPDRDDKLSIWAEEGWGAALWFTDAATSCGAALTRVCVEAFMNRPEGYDAHGLFDHRQFLVRPPTAPSRSNCLSVARWQDSGADGRGAWVSQTPNGEFACYDTPTVTYRP
jgi:ABC-type branched-subunit amino acid transport system substrate-binding protein